MKRYVVFYGDNYYPRGGSDDYHSEFDTLKEAENCVESLEIDEYTWAHIYDLEERKKILEK